MRLNSGAKSRLEQIAHHAVSVFLKHEGTKHGVLYLGHMGLQLAKFIDHLRLVLGSAPLLPVRAIFSGFKFHIYLLSKRVDE